MSLSTEILRQRGDVYGKKEENKLLYLHSCFNRNTDYILLKEENFDRALEVLASEGYMVV